LINDIISTINYFSNLTVTTSNVDYYMELVKTTALTQSQYQQNRQFQITDTHLLSNQENNQLTNVSRMC